MTGQLIARAGIEATTKIITNPGAQHVLETGVETVATSVTQRTTANLGDILSRLATSSTKQETLLGLQELQTGLSSRVGAARDILAKSGMDVRQFDNVVNQLEELQGLLGKVDDTVVRGLLEKGIISEDLAGQIAEIDVISTQFLDDAVKVGTDGANTTGLLEQAPTIEGVIGKAEGKLAHGVEVVNSGQVKTVVPETNVTGNGSTVGEAEIVNGQTVKQGQPQTTNPNEVQFDDVDVDVTQGADDFSRGRAAGEPKVETSAEANTNNQKVFTEDEVERRVQERLKEIEAQGGTRTGNVPDDPIEKILHGAENIVAGEFQNMSSEVGLLMKATGMTPEKVNGLMRKFVTPELRGDLEKFLRAQLEGHENPLSLISHLGPKEQQGIKWLGRLVNVGAKIPGWAFDTMAFAGSFVDYFDWALRKLPGGRLLLDIPFMRKFITGFGQFVGRFSSNIKQIGEGVKEFQSSVAKNTSGASLGSEAVGAIAETAAK